MNNFAITSAGIGEALQRSASALYEAGNTIDESIGLVTAANSVIQNPEQVGTALKTLALRLRGAKTELEEAGEDVDGMAESTSQLQAKLKALTHGKVDIMLDANTFKSTTEILREMSQAWKDMTDIERASALELMGGKRQANILSSVISNFQTVEDVIKTSTNSQGSALEENAKWLDSIEGKTYQFTNALETMWSNMIDSEAVKTFIDFGTGFIKFLDTVPGKIIAVTAAVAGLAKFKGFSILGLGQDAGKSLQNYQQALYKLQSLQSMGINIGSGDAYNTSAITAYAQAVDGLTAKKQAEMLVTAGLNKEQIIEVMTRNNIDEAVAKEITSKMTLTNATKALHTVKVSEILTTEMATDATKEKAIADFLAANGSKTLTAELLAQMVQQKLLTAEEAAAILMNNKLAFSWKSLGASIKAAFMSNPVGMILTIATTVIPLVVKGIDAVTTSAKELKEEVNELTSTYEDAKKTLDNNLTALTTSSDTSLYATLEDEFTRLTAGVDALGNNVSLTADQYERYKQICEQIVGIQPSIASGYDSATKAIGNNASVLSNLIELQKIEARQNAQEYVKDDNLKKIAQDKINDYKNVSQELAASLGDTSYDYFLKNSDWGNGNWETYGDKKASSTDVAEYILDRLGIIDFKEMQPILEKYINTDDTFNWGNFMRDYADKISDSAAAFPSAIQDWANKYKAAKSEMKSAQNGFIDSLLQIPTSMDEYDKLSDSSKSWITKWIKNSDLFKIDENTTQETILEYKSTIKEMIRGIANGDYTTELENGTVVSASDILDSIFKLDASTVDWAKYKEQVNELLTLLFKALGITDEAEQNAIKISLGLDFEVKDDGGNTKQQQLIDDISRITGEDKKTVEERLNNESATTVTAMMEVDWSAKAGMTYDEIIAEIKSTAPDITDVVSVKTYSALTEEIENYNDILKQTAEIVTDNTEVTQEYKDSLIALGISEEDLADCFDKTNPLIIKNSKLLNNLVKSSKNNIAQNVSLAKTQARLQYYELYKKIKTLTGAQGELAKANVQEINALYKEMGTVEQTIAKYSMLEQQLLGAADAYQKYEEAKTADEEKDYGSKASDMISGVIEGLQSAKLGTESFKAAVMGMIPEEVYSNLDTVEAKVAAIANYLKNSDFSKYFTLEFDDNGTLQSAKMTLDNVRAFIETGLSEEKGVFVGQDWQHFELSDDIKTLDDFCNAMKITKEMAFAMFTEIDSYDAEWLNGDFGSIFDKLDLGSEGNIFMATKTLAELDVSLANNEITVDEWAQKYQEANNKLQGCAEDARKNAVEYQTVTEEVSSLKDELDQATKKLNELNQPNSGATEQEIQAQTRQVQVLSTQLGEAIKKKYNLEEPTEMSIQLALDDIESQMSTLEATLASNGIDIKAEIANIDDSELIELGEDGKYKVKPGIDDTNVQSYIDLLNDQSVIDLLVENDEEAKAQIEEVQTAAEAAKKAVEAIPDPSVDSSAAISSINRLINAINKVPTSLTVTTTYREVSEGQAVTKNTPRSRYEMNFTKSATVNGTAHASGDWGLKQDETGSLIGELGPETLVRDGKWKTIGDNGAEIINLKKGDIIFNHKQTEELMKNGHITSRGKMVGGQAHAEGNAHVNIVPDYTTKSYYSGASDNNFWTSWTNVGDSLSSTSDSLSNTADSLSDATDEFEEVFDWVEIRLQEIDETLDLLNAKLENAVGYSAQNSIIDQILGVSNTKMSNLQAGLQEYANYAAKLLAEIPAQYQAAAQDGSIAITKFAGEADEATVEAINNYREWADKVADLTQRIEELKTEIADLAKQKFDNVSEQYDNIITLIENANEKLEAQVDLMEDRGYVAAKQYYESMIVNTKKQSAELEKEKKALQEVLDQQVKLGNIKVGSDAWYEMVDTLYEVDAAIVECTSSLEEYQNAINDIYWDNFDQLINRIDYLNNETQRLIDLMDSSDMVFKPDNENGWTADQVEWTKEGIASLGLYAQQMEIAEYQSKQYAKAIDDLNKDYQAGKYSENEYLEKLDELTSAQYDSIEAYYDAQEAIKDLNEARIDCIKDGIEKEIDAYQELIDAKKSELQAEKD